MHPMRIFLFGKLEIRCHDHPVAGLDQRKAQDLLCFLLLYRNKPHPRETLAGLLWGDVPTTQSKKYLRQALWQLHSALEARLGATSGQLLVIEPEWIALHTQESVWLDLALFEETFARMQGVNGAQLLPEHAAQLNAAVQLYRGDLLEGWYSEWCLYERERLQNIYLAMLDKLIAYCEAHQLYEEGQAYGTALLRVDRAHERTHRRLMRLYVLAGDRTSALRQYARCEQVLAQELGVEPADKTKALYGQIRDDRYAEPAAQGHPLPQGALPPPPPEGGHDLPALARRLQELQSALSRVQVQIQQNLAEIERSIK
jgi:DNA-binding SARP family transcriptional activator